MITEYKYNGQSYWSEEDVRKAILQNERKIFRSVEGDLVEFWKGHSVDYFETEEAVNEERIAEESLYKAKLARNASVSAIIVEVDGMLFDGGEESQCRMAHYLLALDDYETVKWVMSDNSVKLVTKQQLHAALKQAVKKQAELWAVPYEGESHVKNSIIPF